MQLKVPTSKTVPLFQNLKALLDPSTEKVKVIAQGTTFVPSDHEAVILGELSTQILPENLEVIIEQSTAFCERYHLLAFGFRCGSEEMIQARLKNLVEDVTVHKSTSMGSFFMIRSGN